MAGGKETPRQKMIGMMYLVLTALLALNVSKEILNAFVIMDDGLAKTNRAFDGKNASTYNAFELAMMNDEVKTKPYYDKAMVAKQLSKEMDDFVKLLKKELYLAAGVHPDSADTQKLAFLDGKDNYDIPTNYMIGSDPSNVTGKAKELEEKINKYRVDLLNLLPEDTRATMNIGLTTEDTYSVAAEKEISWAQNNFYHSPIAATIAIFSKIQNDIKNAEGDVINMLFNQVSAADFKFDTLAAKVIANTNYVLLGDTFQADVFVAAFSTTQNPWITVGELDTVTKQIKAGVDTVAVPVSRGVGNYRHAPTAEGLVEWSGLIRIKSPDNSIKSYPFKHSYMVAKPALVVSPTKMNVLYIGVDNPIEISVPGIPAENIVPSLSGGSLSGSKGKYTARVKRSGKTYISVSAKMKDGSTRNMGRVEFRVKRVPDPVAYVAGAKGDALVKSSQLKATQGVIAKLENFDFDLKFNVVSFDMSMNVKGVFVTEKSNSKRVTAAMKNYLKNVKTGTKVYFENVRAKGPDGTVRKIPGVNIKVK